MLARLFPLIWWLSCIDVISIFLFLLLLSRKLMIKLQENHHAFDKNSSEWLINWNVMSWAMFQLRLLTAWSWLKYLMRYSWFRIISSKRMPFAIWNKNAFLCNPRVFNGDCEILSPQKWLCEIKKVKICYLGKNLALFSSKCYRERTFTVK